MGRYLIIGLTTKMGFSKADATKTFKSVKEASDYVSENFAPSDVFEMRELQTPKKIMELADEKEFENFQKDVYWGNIYCGESWNRLRIEREGIDLSLDGKIILECEDGLFDFFAKLICEKLQKYKLSKAICVTIAA